MTLLNSNVILKNSSSGLDEVDLNRLYDRYSGALFFIILDSVQSNKDSEEILEKSFLKIFECINEYEPTKCRLFTWMLKITNNTITEHSTRSSITKPDIVFSSTNYKPSYT
jgi:RNA polymerase sigma-70 factor (ECF subfamily)